MRWDITHNCLATATAAADAAAVSCSINRSIAAATALPTLLTLTASGYQAAAAVVVSTWDACDRILEDAEACQAGVV